MTTTPENVTRWRDLVDELTPAQVATLSEWERNDAQAHHYTLICARDYVEHNLIDLALSEVPLPTGAETDRWEKTGTGEYSRSLAWAAFCKEVAEIAVCIDGRQWSDGTYSREISVYTGSEKAELTTAEARGLAALLLEAADELDETAAR